MCSQSEKIGFVRLLNLFLYPLFWEIRRLIKNLFYTKLEAWDRLEVPFQPKKVSWFGGFSLSFRKILLRMFPRSLRVSNKDKFCGDFMCWHLQTIPHLQAFSLRGGHWSFYDFCIFTRFSISSAWIWIRFSFSSQLFFL